MILLIEPKFVIVTAFLSPSFKEHIRALRIIEAYEKPLAVEQLMSILGIDESISESVEEVNDSVSLTSPLF